MCAGAPMAVAMLRPSYFGILSSLWKQAHAHTHTRLDTFGWKSLLIFFFLLARPVTRCVDRKQMKWTLTPVWRSTLTLKSLAFCWWYCLFFPGGCKARTPSYRVHIQLVFHGDLPVEARGNTGDLVASEKLKKLSRELGGWRLLLQEGYCLFPAMCFLKYPNWTHWPMGCPSGFD